jgi:hypothetical protein
MKTIKQLSVALVVVIFILAWAFASAGCRPPSKDSFPALSGPYLGQIQPGPEPALFAPGIISTGMYERDMAVTPDGKEIYYGLAEGRLATIMTTRLVDGRWTEPRVASFASDPEYLYFEPGLAADGTRIHFLSTRPPEGQAPRPGWGHQNIWAADRAGDGSWGEPYDLGAPVNTADGEFFPSLTRTGTLYFTRSKAGGKSGIWRSEFRDGRFQEPVILPDTVNGQWTIYNACVSPDDSFLVGCVDGRSDTLTPGAPNYYVFFRKPDGSWSEGINLGQTINAPGAQAISPSVSTDGKYFFFASDRVSKDLFASPPALTLSRLQDIHNRPGNGNSDIYWADIRLIESLRPAK